MKRGLILILLLTGCRHYTNNANRPVPKWCAESGVATSYFPNAPCKKYEFEIEKVDLSFKLRREW